MTTSHYDDMDTPLLGTIAELARARSTLPSTLRAKVERENIKPVARLKSGTRTFDLFLLPPGGVNPRHLVAVSTP